MVNICVTVLSLIFEIKCYHWLTKIFIELDQETFNWVFFISDLLYLIWIDLNILANLNSFDKTDGLKKCFLVCENFLELKYLSKLQPTSLTEIEYQKWASLDFGLRQNKAEIFLKLNNAIEILLEKFHFRRNIEFTCILLFLVNFSTVHVYLQFYFAGNLIFVF